LFFAARIKTGQKEAGMTEESMTDHQGTHVPNSLAAWVWGVALGALVGTGAAIATHKGVNFALVIAGFSSVPLGFCAWMSGWSKAQESSAQEQAERVMRLALTLLVTAPILKVLGTLLKVNTHHRALGSVTFTLLGLFLMVGLVVVGRRLATMIVSKTGNSLGKRIGMGLSALVMLWLLVRSGSFALQSLDGVAVVVALGAGFAGGVPRKNSALFGWGSLVTCLVFACYAWYSVHHSPALAPMVENRGWIAAAVWQIIGS
jgi:hypothetical protein